MAGRAPDFLFANDEWFRGLCLTAACDGGIFVADWHDTGECHNYDKTHPSGRIYKIDYRDAVSVQRKIEHGEDDVLVLRSWTRMIGMCGKPDGFFKNAPTLVSSLRG